MLCFLCNRNTWLAKSGCLIDWTYWLNNRSGRRIILVHWIYKVFLLQYTILSFPTHKLCVCINLAVWLCQTIDIIIFLINCPKGEKNTLLSLYTFTREQNKWCTLEVSFQLRQIRYRQIYWVITVVTER